MQRPCSGFCLASSHADQERKLSMRVQMTTIRNCDTVVTAESGSFRR